MAPKKMPKLSPSEDQDPSTLLEHTEKETETDSTNELLSLQQKLLALQGTAREEMLSLLTTNKETEQPRYPTYILPTFTSGDAGLPTSFMHGLDSTDILGNSLMSSQNSVSENIYIAAEGGISSTKKKQTARQYGCVTMEFKISEAPTLEGATSGRVITAMKLQISQQDPLLRMMLDRRNKVWKEDWKSINPETKKKEFQGDNQYASWSRSSSRKRPWN